MKKRQSNIELLRIIAMLGVIVLHINNPAIGGGITFVNEGSINQWIMYLCESMFVVAVNVFIAISGYFMINNNQRNMWRVIELLLQVILFNVVLYFIKVIFRGTAFSGRTLLACFLPVNYYAVLYCVIYLISPYFNIVINNISSKELKTMVGGAFVIFSIIPTGVDVLSELTGNTLSGLSTIGMYGSQFGYSVVNFSLLYLVGTYIQKKEAFKSVRTCKVIAGLVACVICLTCWAFINNNIGYNTERSAWEYCNPLVIIESGLIIILFSRLEIGYIGMINKLAKSTFTVFLLHNVFLQFFNFKKIVNQNAAIMCFKILSIVIGIYIVCWCVDFIYKKTALYILSKFEMKVKLAYKVGDDL